MTQQAELEAALRSSRFNIILKKCAEWPPQGLQTTVSSVSLSTSKHEIHVHMQQPFVNHVDLRFSITMKILVLSSQHLDSAIPASAPINEPSTEF